MSDPFVTQSVFEDAIAKMNDISQKLDRELRSVRHAGGLEGLDIDILLGGHHQPMVLPPGEESRRPYLAHFCRRRQQAVWAPACSNPLGELTHLRRTGSIDNYQEQFLKLLARCEGVTKQQQIDIFTANLLQPMSIDVEMHKPETLEDAMALARAYERRTQVVDDGAHSLVRSSRSLSHTGMFHATPAWSPSKSLASSASSTKLSAPVKPVASPSARFTLLTPVEMAHHRLDSLCFNCPVKFSREHAKQSSMKGIYWMELEGDDDVFDGRAEDEPTISVNAIIGIQTSSTLQLATVVHAVGLTTLVDSGSTHSFIAADTAARLGLTPEARLGLTVGDRVPSIGVCRNVIVHIGQEKFCINLFVIPLDGYELVLGCEWLRTLGPILWDFTRLSMAFWCQDHRVKWFRVNAWPSPRLALTGTSDLLALLLQEFDDLFVMPSGLPPLRAFDHRIHLLPATPLVAVRPYRYPQLLKDEIEAQCQAMLEQGIIRASTSAFSSPVLLVHKRDDTWHFYIDYCTLNLKTVRDKFPIPVVEELPDELKGAIFFSKLDLRSGYHQVQMHPEDVSKMVFCTHHDHFEFLVMPFGLTNAPSMFQALMNDVLWPFLRRCILVFFNNILIYNKSWTEHLQHVRAVFFVLREHNLILKLPKCLFGEHRVHYLGHIIANNTMAMDADKISAVQAWPLPRSVKVLHGFLGLTSYYR
ncbi:uncharacterized protein LOC111256735 [Setaria italica]|uniref:uncharacterized protein LOC111256735 n=1 Tax=Setaria italica TaxID=4555 RepID=UPI000BE5120B|nr:uncharacterized protein LOC111256735 [Setaria italica]